MKRLVILLAIHAIVFSTPAYAQRANRTTVRSAPTLSSGEVQGTPEMWFYDQERRRYDDPKTAVRANAEFRNSQRQQRMAALKWHGYSNARPTASPDPFHGHYSPRFVGNGYTPGWWHGSGNASVVLTQPRVRR
jgi:hypothetical protein